MSQVVDRYVAEMLGLSSLPSSPGQTIVIESSRRLTREPSYDYVRALLWLWLENGRSFVSVPPGAGPHLVDVVSTVASPDALFAAQLAQRLGSALQDILRRHGLAPVQASHPAVVLTGGARGLRIYQQGHCQRLLDEHIPAVSGLIMPKGAYAERLVYGVIVNGRIVSVAYAHRTKFMQDNIADIGIETAARYRRRGYAQTALSHLVADLAVRGGEAFYTCLPGNSASLATAHSVGLSYYGKQLVLASPSPEGIDR